MESVQLFAGEVAPEPDIVPHNTWDEKWQPFTPELAAAFTTEPISWSETCPNASMVVLFNEVCKMFTACGISDELVNFAAVAMRLAVAEDLELTQHSKRAAGWDALVKKFDVYISHGRLTQTQAEFSKQLYIAVTSQGHQPCNERLTLETFDQIAPLVGECRVFLLVLTSKLAASPWAMRELCAAISAGLHVLLVSLEDDLELLPTPAEIEAAVEALVPGNLAVIEKVQELFASGFEARTLVHSHRYADAFARVLSRRCGVSCSASEQLAMLKLPEGHDVTRVEEAILEQLEMNLLASEAESNSVFEVAANTGSFTRNDVYEPVVVVERTAGQIHRVLSLHEFNDAVNKLRAARLVYSQRTAGTVGHTKNFSNDTIKSMARLSKVSSMVLPDNGLGHTQTGMAELGSLSSATMSDAVDFLSLESLDEGDISDLLQETVKMLKAQLKPLVAFFQINASLSSNFTMKWPPMAEQLFSAFGILNVNFSADGLNAQLGSAVNFATQTIAEMMLFLCFMLGMAAAYVLLANTRGRRLPERREAFFDKFVQLSVVIMFLLHPSLSAKLLKLFVPREFGDQEVLSVDWSLGIQEIAPHQSIAIFFLLLYTVGIPVFFFIGLWHTARPKPPSELYGAAAAKAEKLQMRRETRYVMLFSIYEPQCWWWELVEVSRKLTMTALVIFVPPEGSTSQITVTLLIGIAFLLASTYFAPFEDDLLDITNFASQTSTCLTLLVMIVLRTEIINEPGTMFTEAFLNTFLSVAQIIVPIIAVAVAMVSALTTVRKERADVKELVAKVAPVLSDSEPITADSTQKKSCWARLKPTQKATKTTRVEA